MLELISHRMELKVLHDGVIVLSVNYEVNKKYFRGVNQSAKNVLMCIKMQIFLLPVHDTRHIALCPQAVGTLFAELIA
jgi:hypothetical protein